MTGSELLSTPDAQVWAKEFCETFGGNTVNGGVVDLELMFGWFANAMEAGRMQVSSATPSPTIAADAPSNEVTAEMVDAAMRELDFGDGPPLDVAANRNAIRAAIEAALKARKPSPSLEDDGWIPFAEHEIVRKERDIHLETLARIEHAMAIGRAAMKARKPAGDGLSAYIEGYRDRKGEEQER